MTQPAQHPIAACSQEYLAGLYHDGELPPQARAAFEAHAAACPACAATLDDLRRLSSLFSRSTAPPASRELLAALHKIPIAERDRSLAYTAGALTGLAAAMLLAGSAWLWLHRGASQIAPGWERAAVAGRGDAAQLESPELQLAEWVVADLSVRRRR